VLASALHYDSRFMSLKMVTLRFGVNMGEVIQFVSKSERERLRLIAEARAIYESIFPPAAEKAPVRLLMGGANSRRDSST